MNTKKIITQFKRELWENKSGFIFTPLIITGLYLLIAIGLFIYLGVTNNFSMASEQSMSSQCSGDFFCYQNHGDDTDTADKQKSVSLLANIVKDPTTFNGMILQVMYANCALLTVIFFFVLATYVLRCLFEDRKNREILFWRSMPVSEATNVLVKVAMILLAAPLILLLINELVTFIFFIVGIIIFSFHGVSISYLIASVINGSAFFIPLQIFYENIFGLFMLMPIIGYLLFASAFAKKSPFLTSVLIPVVLIVMDVMLNKVVGISLGIIDVLGLYTSAIAKVKSAYLLQNSLLLDGSILLPFIASLFIGALFVSGAIWLRNNRYEI
jgi:ABC-2 type transport system permease protein